MNLDETLTAAEIERLHNCEVQTDYNEDGFSYRAVQRGVRRGVFTLTMWRSSLQQVLDDLNKTKCKS